MAPKISILFFGAHCTVNFVGFRRQNAKECVVLRSKPSKTVYVRSALRSAEVRNDPQQKPCVGLF
jgi:hypothetical protein